MQAEGSGESTHLHRLTLAFVTVPKSRVLPQMAIFCSIHPGAKTLVSLHICAGVVTGQCNKYQDLSCRRRLWRVCTPEPRQSTEISCAGSNGSGSALAAGSILSGFVWLQIVCKVDVTGNKTVHRQDNSPTRFLKTVHRQIWRQFTDTFEDSSSTLFLSRYWHNYGSQIRLIIVKKYWWAMIWSDMLI